MADNSGLARTSWHCVRCQAKGVLEHEPSASVLTIGRAVERAHAVATNKCRDPRGVRVQTPIGRVRIGPAGIAGEVNDRR